MKKGTQKTKARDIRNLIVVTIMFVALLYATNLTNYTYLESLDGKTYFVQYTELNVRETPGGTIIDELSFGNKVLTTGQVYDFEGKERWIQIVLDDGVTTAWIIDSGIGL